MHLEGMGRGTIHAAINGGVPGFPMPLKHCNNQSSLGQVINDLVAFSTHLMISVDEISFLNTAIPSVAFGYPPENPFIAVEIHIFFFLGNDLKITGRWIFHSFLSV